MKHLFKYSLIMMIIFPINLSFGMESRRQNDKQKMAADRAIKMEKLAQFHRLQSERVKYLTTITNILHNKETKPLQKLAVVDALMNKHATTTKTRQCCETKFLAADVCICRQTLINIVAVDVSRLRLMNLYLAKLAKYMLESELSDEEFKKEFANFMAELNQAHLSVAVDLYELVGADKPDGFIYLNEFVLLYATRIIFGDEQLKKDFWIDEDGKALFNRIFNKSSALGEKSLYENLHTTTDAKLKYFAFRLRSTIKHNTSTVAHILQIHYNYSAMRQAALKFTDGTPVLKMVRGLNAYVGQLNKPVTHTEFLNSLQRLYLAAQQEFFAAQGVEGIVDPSFAQFLPKTEIEEKEAPKKKKKKKRSGKKNRKKRAMKKKSQQLTSKEASQNVVEVNENVVDEVFPTGLEKTPLEIPCEISDENPEEESTSTSTTTTSVEEEEDAVENNAEIVVYEKKYRGCNREYKNKLKDARDEKRNKHKNKEKKKSKKKTFNKPERKFLKKIVFAPKTSWKKYNWKKVSKMLVKAGWKVSNSTGSSAVHLTPRDDLHSVIGGHTISIDAPHDTSETPMPAYVVNHLKAAFKKKYKVDETDLLTEKKSKK